MGLSAIKRILSKNDSTNTEVSEFLKKNLQIFWIIGPPGCGKSTLAEMIAKSSKYHLINVKRLIEVRTLENARKSTISIKQNPISCNEVLNTLKKEILHASESAFGFVIDGYPTNLREAKLFEQRICNVDVIIYVTLILDGLLARKVTQIGEYDVNEERLKYIKSQNHMKQIFKHYERKVIKLHANYPPEATCAKIIAILEDFWGFKFLNLYNKHLAV